MDWKKERDALLAQTMAFVQSVTGKAEIAARPRTPAAPLPQPAVPPASLGRQDARAKPAPTEKPPEAVAPPAVTRPEQLAPLSLPQTDLKREIQDRIASFRAHQERFNGERAEYFNATLAKLRTTIDEGPASPRGND